MKSVCIRSFSGPYFPAFGLNTERYGVSLHIQSECGKILTRKTPNKDTFHAVRRQEIHRIFQRIKDRSKEKNGTTVYISSKAMWTSVSLDHENDPC